MPEYLSPGVYIEEVNTGPRPIEGVGTAMAAFIGFAPAGPPNQPQLITNWTQYVNAFGSLDESGRRNPHMPNTFLSHAVYGYFLNGGGRCYVTRVVAPTGRPEKPVDLQLPSRASKAVPSLTISSRATPTSDIQVEIAPPTGENPPEGSFTVKMRTSGGFEEVYENVSLGSKGVKNVAETVNQASKLVTVAVAQGTGTLLERAPEIGSYLLKAPAQTTLATVQPQHLVGSADERTGIEGMEIAEDVTMVCCPDLMSPLAIKELGRDGIKAVQLA
ncbi:MAG: phage tail sheath family protein, partial [Roseiflexaceae bacterium]|nr:phage tail sheath family protein [Roseiflexaceae bacterium]